MTRILIVIILLGSVLALVGCGEKLPDRNQIPVIKEQLFKLQEAVKSRDKARVDSLLSVDILDNQQGSDSLLNLVYGPSGDFAFEQFALGQITYIKEHARIKCFVMDTTHQYNRPLEFMMVNDDDIWLLKKFEVVRDTVTDE